MKYIILLIIVFFSSCDRNCKEKIIIAHDIGWKQGANAVINSVNNKLDFNCIVDSLHRKDSLYIDSLIKKR